jgi:hypothetical protein
MALTDFLFNGSPPASTTTYGSSTSSLPAWYNDYTQGLISKANAIAASPYQAYSGARIAGFQPQQEQAFQNTGNLAQSFQSQFDPSGNITGGAFAPAAQMTQNAGQGNSLDQYGSQNVYNQAMGPGITNQFNQSVGDTIRNVNQSSAGNVNQYLSPYIGNVVSQAGRQGAQDLNAALSNVNDKYIGSGQFGGSRMGAGIGNAITQSNANTLANQSSLLNQGYTQALGASQADLSRQLQGAQQLGGLASTQQQNLANIGNQLGQFGSADLSRQLQAGQQLGQIAQTAGASGLQQNAALQAAAQQQQQNQQQQLDTAYQDFQNQVQYPYQQASFLNNIIRGLQIPATQTFSQTGPASVYQPSPLSQLAAVGTGIAGLSKLGS